MSRGANWAGLRARNVMRRRGYESKRGTVPIVALLLPSRPKPHARPKEELRSEAERLVAEFLAQSPENTPRRPPP